MCGNNEACSKLRCKSKIWLVYWCRIFTQTNVQTNNCAFGCRGISNIIFQHVSMKHIYEWPICTSFCKKFSTCLHPKIFTSHEVSTISESAKQCISGGGCWEKERGSKHVLSKNRNLTVENLQKQPQIASDPATLSHIWAPQAVQLNRKWNPLRRTSSNENKKPPLVWMSNNVFVYWYFPKTVSMINFCLRNAFQVVVVFSCFSAPNKK